MQYLFCVQADISPEEKRAAEKKILDECKATTKGTEDDINLILDRKVPTNYDGKCMVKCAHEKIGIVRIFCFINF